MSFRIQNVLRVVCVLARVQKIKVFRIWRIFQNGEAQQHTDLGSQIHADIQVILSTHD